MMVHKTIVFNNHNIDAIVDTRMNIWFNAKDIAESLDYSRPKKVIIVGLPAFLSANNVSFEYLRSQ